MKNPTKKSPPRSDKHRNAANHSAIRSEHGLDRLAIELDSLARKFLPNGVLRGTLSNQEDEIRNDAVILALRWFLRQDEQCGIPGGGEPLPAWHAPREIANALRFARLRYTDLMLKGALHTEPLDELNGGSTPHPSHLLPHEWPEPITRELLCRGIRLAAGLGRISHANASIARLVYLSGVPVSTVAACRGVHRSAVNQRLRRVNRVLREILEQIEIPPSA
jgi:hypothetical protein